MPSWSRTARQRASSSSSPSSISANSRSPSSATAPRARSHSSPCDTPSSSRAAAGVASTRSSPTHRTGRVVRWRAAVNASSKRRSVAVAASSRRRSMSRAAAEISGSWSGLCGVGAAGQAHDALDAAGHRVAHRRARARGRVEDLVVVRGADHGDRVALLQRRADAVGPDRVLRQHEPLGGAHAVHQPRHRRLARPAAQHARVRVAQQQRGRRVGEVGRQRSSTGRAARRRRESASTAEPS